MIDLKDLPAHLEKIEKQDWQKLVDLIDAIKKTKKFCEPKGMEKIGDNTCRFPYW